MGTSIFVCLATIISKFVGLERSQCLVHYVTTIAEGMSHVQYQHIIFTIAVNI